MRPSPKRPGQAMHGRKWPVVHQIVEELAHFRHTQRHHHGEVSPRLRLNSENVLGRNGVCGWCSRFFPSCSACSGSWLALCRRSTVRKACASMQSVICRYQPCQERTSYSSSPTSPLPTSKHCSTVQRDPMTVTISCKVVPVRANTST